MGSFAFELQMKRTEREERNYLSRNELFSTVDYMGVIRDSFPSAKPISNIMYHARYSLNSMKVHALPNFSYKNHSS